MSYLDDLSRELGAVGIRGRLRARIVAEADDHLRSDDEARTRFGAAHEIANAFAAELGARASRRAAVGAFAALGVAGAVYAVSFVGASFAGTSTDDPPLASLAFLVIVLAPQLAFVAGALALLRVWRRRLDRVLASGERTIIHRRTGLALACGLVTMLAQATYAFELRHGLAHWWVSFTLVGSVSAFALLLLASLPALGAVRLHPRVAGAAGDVFDDLGLPRYRSDPWRFARRVALLVGLAVWIAGIAASDPFDGALRGVFEALACLGGFAVLGRFLGLRT